MSINIDRGLFLLDFTDFHAVLGVPVDADTQTIRKRYLKIARRLHPDSCASESETDKQRASEFLSKLVNPAWERLSQEKERTEYDLLLRLKGQQALQQSSNLELGALGKELTTASNPDHFYRSSLKNLTEKQFEHLDQTLDIIGQISELNMAFLMRKEGQGVATPINTGKTIYTGRNLPDSSQSTSNPGTVRSAPPPPPRRESVSDQYYRRAEGYASKNNFAQAVLELRDALRLDPKNSQCHALLGELYLRQKQLTMAKIHFNKALELDPQNEMALQGKQKLEAPPPATVKGKKNQSAAQKNPKTGKPSSNGKSGDSGGGLFGLFGGKKK